MDKSHYLRMAFNKRKNLSSDLRSFIESAKKGSNLFSMGTNFRIELLSHDEKEMFFKV